MIKKKRNREYILKKVAILYFTIKIQKYFKKYLERIKLSDQLVQMKEGNFINETTFIGIDYNNLKSLYFYKHNNFFFDIRELRKHIINSNKNPYNNTLFSKFTLRQIKRIFIKVRNNINYESLQDEYADELSHENIITSMKTSIFSKIDDNIGTSNFGIFNNFRNIDLLHFIEIIFNYDLISINFYVEREMDILDDLYNSYMLEKRRNRSSRGSNEFIHNFNFNHKILTLLNEILIISNDNIETICHILNESILMV